MKINLTPIELIDQLRAWFHPKDRAVVIPTTLTTAILSGGATLALALIQEQVLSASATTMVFRDIPQNFRNLLLISQLRTDVAAEADTALWLANGDGGSNYDRTSGVFFGNNTSSSTGVIATAGGYISGTAGANARANNFETAIVIFPGYALTDREKWSLTLYATFGNVSATSDMILATLASRWRNTTGIRALTITAVTGPNFVSGSRATLYGLL